MPIDPKYLREQYASLSDEALMAIDRAELVEAAQRLYDEEVARRRENTALDDQPLGDGDEPDWLQDASEVFSRVDRPGALPADDIADARAALEAEGIPCHVDLSELPQEEEPSNPPPTHIWRVMVPGNLNQHATSVLDRDIFNANFEAQWKTHLETLSDDEVLEMNPEVVFCGLFDRVERVTRAYEAEIARRKLDNAI
jgi:hypothetical protein